MKTRTENIKETAQIMINICNALEKADKSEINDLSISLDNCLDDLEKCIKS